MRIPESFDDFYYQQGYNYADFDPSGKFKLGGGCQASSLLMAIRLVTTNQEWSMDDVSKAAVESGLVFNDPKYANRISYVAIPVVAAKLLPNFEVNLSLASNQEDISVSDNSSFYSQESNSTYLNMPNISNLKTTFGMSSKVQTENIRDALIAGGIAVPLVHPNTLFNSDNPETQGFLHAMVLYGYDENTDKVRVLDPSPGFSRMRGFSKQKAEGRLRIVANKIHPFERVNMIASKHHPMGRVDYEVPLSLLEQSLRYVSTTIVPK